MSRGVDRSKRLVCVCAHHADLRRAAERALKVQHGTRLLVRSAPHALRLPTRRAPTRFMSGERSRGMASSR